MDTVISIFRLENRRGYFCPRLSIDYLEKDTGTSWRINCGGTRLYLLRHGPLLSVNVADPDEIERQAADSHFMVERILGALLVSGAGLFVSNPVARIICTDASRNSSWTFQLDMDPFSRQEEMELAKQFNREEFGDWIKFICENIAVRRAVYDLYLALNNHAEAFLFLYRGFEWIKSGLRIGWDEIASDAGVSTKDMRAIKEIANVETGVRHATKLGNKMRADTRNYGTWACGLLEAINGARCRIQPEFNKMDAKTVAERIKIAVSIPAYP